MVRQTKAVGLSSCNLSSDTGIQVPQVHREPCAASKVWLVAQKTDEPRMLLANQTRFRETEPIAASSGSQSALKVARVGRGIAKVLGHRGLDALGEGCELSHGEFAARGDWWRRLEWSLVVDVGRLVTAEDADDDFGDELGAQRAEPATSLADLRLAQDVKTTAVPCPPSRDCPGLVGPARCWTAASSSSSLRRLARPAGRAACRGSGCVARATPSGLSPRLAAG